MKKIPLGTIATLAAAISSSCTKQEKSELAEIDTEIAFLERKRDDQLERLEALSRSFPKMCGHDRAITEDLLGKEEAAEKSLKAAEGSGDLVAIEAAKKSLRRLEIQLSGLRMAYEEGNVLHGKYMTLMAECEGTESALSQLRAERNAVLNIAQTGEQDGARRPATAPDSKSEEKEKPRPESEGRPQWRAGGL